MIKAQVDKMHAVTGQETGTVTADAGYAFAKATNRAHFPLKDGCLSKKSRCGIFVMGDDYPALLRVRRQKLRRSEEDRRLCQRHFWRSEGFHGEAKTRRGRGNMKIQSARRPPRST